MEWLISNVVLLVALTVPTGADDGQNAAVSAPQVTMAGQEAPSCVAVTHFFAKAQSLKEASEGWSHPTPSPWEVHLLQPLGITSQSPLEAELIHAIDTALAIEARSMAGELDTSSAASFERTQLTAIDRRARELGLVYADLLKSLENAGVSKSRLATMISRQIRAEISGPTTSADEKRALVEKLRKAYAGFDQTVTAAFPHLDPTEVLP